MIKTVLDPMSYQVFKFKEKSILYDLSTDAICEIDNELTEDILKLAGKFDIVKLCKELNKKHSDINEGKVNSTIQPLKDAGFFVSEPADWEKIKNNKEKLLARKPSRIQLCIAQSCNLGCVYCYAEENESNSRNQLMTFEVAKQSIDYLVKESGKIKKLSIGFFGGEPLLNFKLMKEIVKYTEEITQKTDKIFSFGITTNATLLNNEVRNFLAKNRVATTVSIDGSEEIHDRQRPFRDGSGSFRQALTNSLALKNKFIRSGMTPPRVRANVINGSAKELSNIAETFSQMGFKAIAIAPIFGRPGEDTPFAITDKEFDELKKQMDDYIENWLECKEKGKMAGNGYVERQVRKKFDILASKRLLGGIRCGAGRGTNIVDVDGNIYPCHRYPGMDEYIIGNVYTGINQEKLSSYYDEIINNMLKNCANCWMRYKCGGPCPWRVSTEEGHICPSDKLSCDERKYSFMQGAYLYVRILGSRPELLKQYCKNIK